MTIDAEKNELQNYWLVGAAHGEEGDQTERFVREGIWESADAAHPLDEVKAIEVGAPIAIKSTYTRKNNLPFDNRERFVSVMEFKAVGVVKANPGDGTSLKINWKPIDPPRIWYFFTNRRTIWRVRPNRWQARALIDFVFEGKEQDIDRFRNAPYWRDRYGDTAEDTGRFAWTRFYEAFATKLLDYRDRRDELLRGIHAISGQIDCMSELDDQYEEGAAGEPLKDICPFTVMALFNRGLKYKNRVKIAVALARALDVPTDDIPDSFPGIPAVNNLRTWFFGYHYARNPDDIDALWEVFSRAIALADSGEDESAERVFIEAYNDTEKRHCVGWNLTMGLYWARPWQFPSLDGPSRDYIEGQLGLKITKNSSKRRCTGEDYLTLLNTLEEHFEDEDFRVHSFPELAYVAGGHGGGAHRETTHTPEIPADLQADGGGFGKEKLEATLPPYTIDNIVDEGSFLGPEALREILKRIEGKKNLILQGPPGTRKTWLAKRLAFALVGRRDKKKVRAIQFHPNLSYEDFIRGWRPSGAGKLTLVDGPFMEMVERAKADPGSKYAVVIEEINRGNPAHIFGEMLTLLEADKRIEDEALELTYRRGDDERVYVPENLYVIGTMNIADRSLALVDLALRRRFAFVDLEPTLGARWREWVCAHGVDSTICDTIKARMDALNETITKDRSLGVQFKVGHSYVTPTAQIDDERAWFRQVIETEVGPLLDEYWFDHPEQAKKATQALLEGF